jgi:3-oxoacyl-[acyl-carrier-protein] synthase II
MDRGNRVVVTGMGLRSPLGHTVAALKHGLVNGVSGVRTMPDWGDLDGMRTRVAGPCEGVNEDAVPRKFKRTMGRVGILSVLAVQDALADAGVPAELVASNQCGVSFGSTAGSSQSQEDFLRPIMIEKTMRGLQSSTYLHFMSHTCAANIALMFGCKGPVIASCTACTSGSQGIGIAYEQIRFGRAPLFVAGGAEELHVLHGGVFDIMFATSRKYNDEPSRTPRPFDADRDGLVVGEGAGCLVLEEYEHARKRGAHIHAEIIGYGQGCNGTHPTNSDPEGIRLAIDAALRDAQLNPDDIGHINAHATATGVGDAAEAEALHKLFGERVPISALKGYMGHTLGACGALESIAEIIMLNDGFLAASRNLENPDPQFAPLDHVMGGPRERRFKIGMNNNFAFGGINTSLVFRAI